MTELSVYVSTQRVEEASSIVGLVFNLHNKDESRSISFADKAIHKSGTENITNHFTFDAHPAPIIAPLNEPLPISLSVYGNFSFNHIGVFFTFIGIETSEGTPKVEATSSDYQIIDIVAHDSNSPHEYTYRRNVPSYDFLEQDFAVRSNRMDINVIMHTHYARLGGLLCLRLSVLSTGTYIRRLHQEKNFKILSNISGTLAAVPTNTYAVYPLPTVTVVSPDERDKTIMCLAMGSPGLEVALTKWSKQGQVEVKSLEKLVRTAGVAAVKVYRLYRNDSDFEGKYTCR